jgi:AraC-like DNA-binding protein
MLQFDKPLLDRFGMVEVRAEDLDLGGSFTRNLAAFKGIVSYRVRNRAAWRQSPGGVLSLRGIRRDGAFTSVYLEDRCAAEADIVGDGLSHQYCLIAMQSGALEMVSGPNGTAVASGTKGMILRGLQDTRFVTSDNATRLTLWIDAARLERALAARLGEPARQELVFSPRVDWSAGPAMALWRMMVHLVDELRDPRGLVSEPVALETFTELLLQSILNRLEHNFSARLDRPAAAAIPGHLRRAEAFMHAFADRSITLADVAAAAGCSLGTLQAAFRRFRDTTPLSALHDIRLQRVREALLIADRDESTRAIARRFGFTNPSRFIAAYGRRFGERPRKTRGTVNSASST